MRTIIYLILLFSPLTLIAQESESYFPLDLGKEKTLTWHKDKYVESFTDSTEIGGKKYYVYTQKFKKASVQIPIRIRNDTVYHWNEVKKRQQVFFGINAEVGETIGLGTIKKVGAKLRTPKGKLKDLLVIEMNYSNGMSDIRYYQKGTGLVAVKNDKGLICYIIPD